MILTLKMDRESQVFFNRQRELYFPTERNFLKAHLTLFHQLPGDPAIIDRLADLQPSPFDLSVPGLMNLGAGVAYRIESAELHLFHKILSLQFAEYLIPQDKQPFRPHITLMNKSTPEKARTLMADLSANFRPFKIKAIGFDLWTYLGGPWVHEQTFDFTVKSNL